MSLKKDPYVGALFFSRPQLTVVGGVTGSGKTSLLRRLVDDETMCVSMQQRFIGDVERIQMIWKSTSNSVVCAPVVIIDGLDMIMQYGKRESRSVQLGDIIRDIKRWQIKCALNIIVSCGVNRNSFKREDPRPRIHELRGSGDIEETADMVVMLHRPNMYDPEEEPGIEARVLKNRFGRPGFLFKFDNSDSDKEYL